MTTPTFLRKLFRILSHENTRIVGWDVSGAHFTIRTIATMEASILPHYFPHMTFATFREQLLAHGFEMSHQASDTESFRHPILTRRVSLASMAKRPRQRTSQRMCSPPRGQKSRPGDTDLLQVLLTKMALHSTEEGQVNRGLNMYSSWTWTTRVVACGLVG
ncbi:Aste57867_9372 [Aphanomyces stellatus]|uniref:Aste57867_9372 protein n=1 Tax=Aphanomyces stellatus TaxID=120398 RepID=A0A485KMS9_9STRA|nr:hypothetical protein As57867_009336 [Aphanomyces stellatus]VFT86253.1 Aste57867_9372 [Aphanomyces stellatus]